MLPQRQEPADRAFSEPCEARSVQMIDNSKILAKLRDRLEDFRALAMMATITTDEKNIDRSTMVRSICVHCRIVPWG